METRDLINEIAKLPVPKRMFVIEKSIQSLRKDEENDQMKKASDLLLDDYKNNQELTAFSSIDFDDFYETR